MQFKEQADKIYSKLEKKEDGYYKPRKVYPVFNEDGSFNWFNFLTGGSWWKLITVILFVLIAIGTIYEYHSNLKVCTEVMSDINAYKILNNEKIVGHDSLRMYQNISWEGVINESE